MYIYTHIHPLSLSLDLSESPLPSRAAREVLRPFFSKYDADKSGIIALDELNQCFVDLGERKKPAELNAIFKDFDADNSGGISFSEVGASSRRRSRR